MGCLSCLLEETLWAPSKKESFSFHNNSQSLISGLTLDRRIQYEPTMTDWHGMLRLGERTARKESTKNKPATKNRKETSAQTALTRTCKF